MDFITIVSPNFTRRVVFAQPLLRSRLLGESSSTTLLFESTFTFSSKSISSGCSHSLISLIDALLAPKFSSTLLALVFGLLTGERGLLALVVGLFSLSSITLSNFDLSTSIVFPEADFTCKSYSRRERPKQRNKIRTLT